MTCPLKFEPLYFNEMSRQTFDGLPLKFVHVCVYLQDNLKNFGDQVFI